MNKNKMITRLSDKLESKVQELELVKLHTMSDEFYDLSQTKQLAHLAGVDKLRVEIQSIKSEINSLEERYTSLKVKYDRTIQDGELWLGDIIKYEKPQFGSNNLILSPVGSGKSYAIKNNFAVNGGEYQLLLVPSRHLKNTIAPDNNDHKRELDGARVFTTSNHTLFGDGDYKIHIMTYAEFGWRIRNNDNFIEDNNINQIYCDEVHSLVEYKNYNGDEPLTHALRYLFLKHEGITIYYFTATTEHLEALFKKDSSKFDNIKTFNYLEYPNVKKYTSKSTYTINHLGQIQNHLRAHTGDFKRYGYKGLVFHKTITGQKEIAQVLESEGFTPLVLWSSQTSSEHGNMSDEQFKGLNEIIETGEIPAGYDFLVINSAMREGWDLVDDRVEIAIINSISETDQVQARGRIRKNISTLIIRTDDRDNQEDQVILQENYLNSPLSTDDKNQLCKELNLIDYNGRVSKWSRVSQLIEDSGYKITDSRIAIDGKRRRVSTITKC